MQNTISNTRRALMFAVLGDQAAAVREEMFRPARTPNRVGLLLKQLEHFKACNDILQWLVSKGLTGSLLLEFIDEKDLGPLTFGQYVIKEINKTNKAAPIIHGRDWN